jgi:hypothetical protein
MASVPRKPKFKPARERSTLDAAVQNVLKELDVS